eukprot:14559882-Alexandrium_andersonii.AAC.1
MERKRARRLALQQGRCCGAPGAGRHLQDSPQGAPAYPSPPGQAQNRRGGGVPLSVEGALWE